MCVPTEVADGIVTVVEKLESDVVRTVTIPSWEPSNLSWIHSRLGRPCPLTVIRPPGTVAPARVKLAEVDPAWTASIGMTSAGTSKTIGSVASQSRSRRRRWGVGDACLADRPSTHPEPFQNIRSCLRSATRLASRAPWLCGPASRRVCYFVETGQSMAVSPTSLALWRR
jgi:hypothetical protein